MRGYGFISIIAQDVEQLNININISELYHISGVITRVQKLKPKMVEIRRQWLITRQLLQVKQQN